MKKKIVKLFTFIVVTSFVCLKVQANNIQLVAGAPTGAPNEPTYRQRLCPSVDWFSEPIAGSYYVAALAPDRGGDLLSKTIAIYRFVPGSPPTNGALEFVASAPTGQCIFDQFTQQDICDVSGNLFSPTAISWYPSAINGEYFFTVTGTQDVVLMSRLGLQDEQLIRVYRFNPEGTVPIEFIDSAPLQASENEPVFSSPDSVDWFPKKLNGLYYFSVVGGSDFFAGRSGIRVYSFDPLASLGTNLSFVGEASGQNSRSVNWLPELISGKSYFAVGGNANKDVEPIRVYQFCVDGCEGAGSSPASRIQLIATAPTSDVEDRFIEFASAVEWLVIGGRYYLAAAVLEDFTLSQLVKERSIRIYEFIPNKNDPSQGSLRFVTSAPTEKECCANQIIDDNFPVPFTLDWLTQDGKHFLVTGGGSRLFFRETSLPENSIRIYEFDIRKEKLSFIAAKDLSPNRAVSVDWFPGLIDKNNYFAAGNQITNFGTADQEMRVYRFRPPCNVTALSC